MNNARRSERLRRKRRSTPGLSQPGSYSLHGNGYVVESEASFLPSSQETSKRPTNESRRIRYQDSPHKFTADSPTPNAEEDEITPDRRRRVDAVDRVRVSLFDILGSAARRPVNNNWNAVGRRTGGGTRLNMDGGTADVRQEDIEIDDVDEDEYEQDAGGSVLWRRIQDSITGRYRVMGPIALLVLLFSFGMGMLLVLDAQISSRSEGREAKWVSIRNTCTATMQMIPKGSISNGARVTADYVTSGVGTVWRKLFRSAWKDTTLDTSMFLTRGELETDILPRLLAAARETASQEAARISKDVPDVGRSQDDDNQFMAFAERYAGDKDLPADYALASTGGTILSCTPSTVLSYARFARQYAQALVTERNRLQLPPRARVILTPEILPGNCWGFRGDRGDVTIGLARPTVVKSVTVEHTPRGSVFSMKSALRRFRVTGLKVGGGTAELGEFMFDAEKETRGHLQSFAVKSGGGKLRAVKVEILSNHGAKNTCVYRVRVHGEGEGLE